ncbi:MAG TPA: hypothetical protein VN495_02260 [Candidatus Paceibacterota bacterium]|nr:hypothetical protein [Candidatus Paceibacterota bacterium]
MADTKGRAVALLAVLGIEYRDSPGTNKLVQVLMRMTSIEATIDPNGAITLEEWIKKYDDTHGRHPIFPLEGFGVAGAIATWLNSFPNIARS